MRPTPHLLAVSIAALLSAPAWAQDSAGTATPTALDTVIVTGTRASDRTALESSSPIDVLPQEVLQATGTTELGTALSRVLPSLNFPRPSLTDGTDSVRPAQLRGLSPDHTLVLVNGKRRHTSAVLNVNGTQGRGSSPVDLNAIPISAIARIEVLRDGAAAQYGSDAIAGVINVVLKDSGEGGSLTAQYGQYSAGDGKQYSVGGDAGFDLSGAGSLHLAAEISDADPTNRAGVDFRARGAGVVDPSYGRKNHRFGDPEASNGKFFANASASISEAAEAYAFANLSRRTSENAANFRVGGGNTPYASVFPEGFLPLIEVDSQDQSLVAGVRGTTAGGWRWDVSGNFGRNTLDFDVNNTINSTLVVAGDRRTRFQAGSLSYDQTLFNIDAAREFDWGLYSPTTLAFGAEYRNEEYTIGAGEHGSYSSATTGAGAQGFTGFNPTDAGSHSRNNVSFYAELDADFSERLNASIAARYEDYSDFGSTVSGKLSLRYAFNDRYALRGTASNGFRAPGLAQQFYSITSSTLISGNYYQVRTFPVDLPVAQAFGAEPLKAEESTNFSLGLVAQPTDSISLSIDAYQIDIDDRIVLSENLTGAAVTAFLESQGYYGVTGGRYFTNAVDTRTRGIDVVGTWRLALGGGELDLSAGYNRNKTEITRTQPNAPELEALGFQRIGRVERGRIEIGAPRDKFNLGATYALGNWSFGGNLTRYGENTVLTTTAVVGSPGVYTDQTFGAKWLTDLSVSYRNDGWTFTVGGDNVFNVYPDEVRPENWGNPASAPSGLFRYSSYSPFGFNGAFAYARIGYRW